MSPVTPDRNDPRLSHGVNDEPVPMSDAYLVLPIEDRDSWVRPVRRAYIHATELGGCGAVTTMGVELAETYAAKPDFYGATFCVSCSMHRPVGADGEFYWDGTTEKVGT